MGLIVERGSAPIFKDRRTELISEPPIERSAPGLDCDLASNFRFVAIERQVWVVDDGRLHSAREPRIESAAQWLALKNIDASVC